MKIKVLIISVLCVISGWLIAQENQDYILTLNKDTLYGKIKVGYSWDNITFVYGKRKVNFHASTLNYFAIANEQGHTVYKAIRDTDGSYIFAEVLCEGRIKLYKTAEQFYRFTRVLHFEEMYYVGASEEDLVPINRKAYYQFMQNIAKEYPHLEEEINQISFKELANLVAMYNNL